MSNELKTIGSTVLVKSKLSLPITVHQTATEKLSLNTFSITKHNNIEI